MGSLMAGWDSPVHDPRTVRSERYKSLTKEENEAYWRSKNTRKLERSSSLPLPNEKKTETSLEKMIKENGWWTWSSSAFLNEPPVTESNGRPTYNYASKFHVAGIASFNSEARAGIKV